MKNLVTILLVLVFAVPAPAVSATDDNRYGRYYVSDDDSYGVIYKGKRYGVDRNYRGYYPNYNYNSPMSDFLSICAGVRERKRDDCIQDAIKERQKLIKRYYD